MYAHRWIAVRLETLGSLVIFASAIFAVTGRETISPAIAGLSVSYALQVTQLLNFLVRLLTELETNIIAVERMNELLFTPQVILTPHIHYTKYLSHNRFKYH